MDDGARAALPCCGKMAALYPNLPPTCAPPAPCHPPPHPSAPRGPAAGRGRWRGFHPCRAGGVLLCWRRRQVRVTRAPPARGPLAILLPAPPSMRGPLPTPPSHALLHSVLERAVDDVIPPFTSQQGEGLALRGGQVRVARVLFLPRRPSMTRPFPPPARAATQQFRPRPPLPHSLPLVIYQPSIPPLPCRTWMTTRATRWSAMSGACWTWGAAQWRCTLPPTSPPPTWRCGGVGWWGGVGGCMGGRGAVACAGVWAGGSR